MNVDPSRRGTNLKKNSGAERREFSGTIPIITSNNQPSNPQQPPATPSNPSIPYVKRTSKTWNNQPLVAEKPWLLREFPSGTQEHGRLLPWNEIPQGVWPPGVGLYGLFKKKHPANYIEIFQATSKLVRNQLSYLGNLGSAEWSWRIWNGLWHRFGFVMVGITWNRWNHNMYNMYNGQNTKHIGYDHPLWRIVCTGYLYIYIFICYTYNIIYI